MRVLASAIRSSPFSYSLRSVVPAPDLSTPLRALPAGPVADRRLRARVLGVDVGRFRRFPALRGERLGWWRGGNEALFRTADEVAPAGVHERHVDVEPVARPQELNRSAL